MHPSFGVPKTILAEVAGPLPRNVGRRLREGVELDDGPARVDSFRLVDALGNTAQVEITLHEGRKHIVRRMLAEVGIPCPGSCVRPWVRSGSATCGRAVSGICRTPRSRRCSRPLVTSPGGRHNGWLGKPGERRWLTTTLRGGRGRAVRSGKSTVSPASRPAIDGGYLDTGAMYTER
jgi:16S rRNA U516 pseudouridylate synthase RsuA-like enzyme